ncbi:IQ calmodulin-binding motif family protein [Trichomonas vaginalis G3]|uniref:IQ calmodulin-binding motif family protein n=1 Tax=Trichomonas vaginalis (strain ATCC PRA-98 / G3) TaxID=412133 RepID=A2FJR9_TRIV3|nr:calmodulin-binding motif IQ-containing protein [Trichomonas vaginalis G3]EAX94851.1 IQ calmodulin-binding motif family protein [Trichomonas vaginalis G3]KAI5485706.1 calmodulin-binding motif IQ-containing protein [Trichomonas vaginalis G3]|eukprot:XP_001307781.1 IQ calmodulin-binding motif family protein [Trichomonas vaginalis G3]
MNNSGDNAQNRSELDQYLDEAEDVHGGTSLMVQSLLDENASSDKYSRLQYQLANKGVEALQNAAATKIQKTFRMYVIHKKYRNIYESLIKAKRNLTRAYFNVLYLNTNMGSQQRRSGAYKQLVQEFNSRNSFPRNYKSVSELTFRITGQTYIPREINEQNLVSFVKFFYAKLMRDVLMEWRIALSKEKSRKELLNPFDFQRYRRFHSNVQFIAFGLWRGWAQNRAHGKIKVKYVFPEWNNYMKHREAKFGKIQKADQKRKDFIGRNALQALSTHMREKHQLQQDLIASDNFRLKQIMRLTYQAWARTILQHTQRLILEHNIIQRWRTLAATNSNLRKLLKIMQARHELYLKRRTIAMFLANIRACGITRAYIYCKLQAKPSLGLSFVFNLMKNDYEAALSSAFAGWSAYVRRRRNWHRFLFQNIKTTEYDVTKKKALAAFRKKGPPYLTPQNFTADVFKQESLLLYERVMKSNGTERNIFLLLNDKKANAAQRNISTAKNRVDSREFFFKAWLQTKYNPSLFIRVAIINHMKRKSEFCPQTEAERFKNSFHRAFYFLQQCNFASAAGMVALKKAIQENSKNAFNNRRCVLARDNLIIKAHAAHESAELYSKENPNFKASSNLCQFDQIKKLTNDLTANMKPLIQLTAISQREGLANDPNFSLIKGCHSRIQSLKPTIVNSRTEYHQKLKRLEFQPIIPQFNNFKGKTNTDNVGIGAKTQVTVDSFTANKVENVSMKTYNKKLFSAVPRVGRRARVINHAIKNKFNVNMNYEEDEEEDLLPMINVQSVVGLKENLGVSNLDFTRQLLVFSSRLSLSSSSFNSQLSVTSGETDIIEENDEEGETNPFKKKHILNLDGFGEIVEENETEEEDYYEEESKVDAIEKLNLDDEEKKTVHQSLDHIFSSSITRNQSFEELNIDPDMSTKYKQFVDILFSDPIALQDANLDNVRRILIEKAEYNAPIMKAAVDTNKYKMPISNLTNAYRKEHFLSGSDDEKEEEEEVNDKKSVASKKGLIARQQSKFKSTDSIDAGQTSISYTSKKYKSPPPKKSVTRMTIGSRGSMTKSVKSAEPDSSDDDDERLFREHQHVIQLESDNKTAKVEEEEDQKESDSESQKEEEKAKEEEEKKEEEKKEESEYSYSYYEEESNVEEEELESDYSYEYYYEDETESVNKSEVLSTIESSHTGESEPINEPKPEQQEAPASTDNETKSTVSTATTPSHHIKKKRRKEKSVKDDRSSTHSRVSTHHSRASSSKLSTKSSEKDTPATHRSRRSRRRHKRKEETPPEPKKSMDFDKLNKVVFQFVEKSVKHIDLENLVEIDPDATDEDMKPTKMTISKPKQEKQRKKLYEPPEAPAGYQPKVFAKRMPKPKKEKKIIVDQKQDNMTNSMEKIIHEGNMLNKVIYNQGQTQIVPKIATKKPLPPFPPEKNNVEYINNVEKPVQPEKTEPRKRKPMIQNNNQKEPIEEFPDFSGFVRIDDPNESKPKKQGPKIQHGLGYKSYPKKPPLEHSDLMSSIEQKSIAPQQKVTQKLLTTVPIKKPIVIKSDALSLHSYSKSSATGSSITTSSLLSKSSSLKSDFNSKALRRIVRQIVDVIATSPEGTTELKRLYRRSAMMRRKPAFVGLKAPEYSVNNQFYDKTQSVLIRYTTSQNVHNAAEEVFEIFSENTENAHILIEEVERALADIKESEKSVLSHQPTEKIDPSTLPPSIAVQLVDLDWMGTLGLSSTGVEIMYKDNGRGQWSAVLAPNKKNNERNERRGKGRRRKKEFFLQGRREPNELPLDELMLVSQYVPQEMVNQVLSKYGNFHDNE